MEVRVPEAAEADLRGVPEDEGDEADILPLEEAVRRIGTLSNDNWFLSV
jgi:hypothetical protein